ncbi:putative reverse transcriptase domain-containing protein [Tanacetum coccineum]
MKTTQNGYEAQLQALIDQGVVAAMAEAEASRHSNAQQLAKVKSRDLHSAEDALTWWIDKIEKYIGGLPDMILGSVKASKSKTMQEVIEFTTELMEDKTHAYAERQAERKRKNDDLSKNNQNQQNKRQNTGQAYTAGNSDRKSYAGSKPLCSKCNCHHEAGPCPPRCSNCNRVGHLTRDCRIRSANNNNRNNNNNNNRNNNNNNNNNRNNNNNNNRNNNNNNRNNNNNNNRNNNNNNQQGNGCFECGAQGHFKSNCPRLRNNDRGNQAGNDRAPAKVYVVGNAGANPDNVVAGSGWRYLVPSGHHVTSRRRSMREYPMVQDFPEVFPKIDGYSSDSTSGDLSEPLKELSDKGFIRPVPCTGELGDDPLSAPRIETYLISSKGRVSTRRSTFKVRTERHEKHRRIVLELLKKEELYAKSSAECLDSQRGDKQEVDFKLLKKKLCSAPILALPEGSEDFIDTATTSKKGFGACVDAERKLISYASRQFLRFMRKTTTTHD